MRFYQCRVFEAECESKPPQRLETPHTCGGRLRRQTEEEHSGGTVEEHFGATLWRNTEEAHWRNTGRTSRRNTVENTVEEHRRAAELHVVSIKLSRLIDP